MDGETAAAIDPQRKSQDRFCYDAQRLAIRERGGSTTTLRVDIAERN
jgi:hypothetical protein